MATDFKLISDRLKTGTIKNVYYYPCSNAKPPYVMMRKTGGRTDEWYVSVHADNDTELIDDYIEIELYNLLIDPIIDSVDNRTITPYADENITPVVINDDGTLSRDVIVFNPVNRRRL